MNTMSCLFRCAVPVAAALHLTACGTREALTDPASDTVACDLVILLPAGQTDPGQPLPQGVLDLLEPLPSGDKKWSWSPHPELRLLREDGSVAAVFRAPAPETDSDRVLGRSLSADERTARFLEALGGKPLKDLLPVPAGGVSEAPSPLLLKDALPRLGATSGGAAPLVFCPAAASLSAEARQEVCPGAGLAAAPEEMRGLMAGSLPAKANSAPAELKVLVWTSLPSPEPLPQETPLAAIPPPDPPAPPAPPEQPAQPGKEHGTEMAALEPPPQPLPPSPVAETPAAPPPAQNVTVNHNYETVVVLPEEPPANLTKPEERENWRRLVKEATPLPDAEFYYDFNSVELNRENAAALAHHKRQLLQQYRGRRVIVGGYSDEVGDAVECAKKAMERADRVAGMLKAAGIDAMPAGYGTAPPDRGGPLTGPDARERRRCVILYLLNENTGSVATEP